VIVIRTPYGKTDEWRDDTFAMRAARSGYVIVTQDVRGRYRSDGLFDPYRQEGAELPALEGAAPSYYEWLRHPDDGPYWPPRTPVAPRCITMKSWIVETRPQSLRAGRPRFVIPWICVSFSS
jgi:hypothetical protein